MHILAKVSYQSSEFRGTSRQPFGTCMGLTTDSSLDKLSDSSILGTFYCTVLENGRRNHMKINGINQSDASELI